ncbi:hypothetical protein TWF506_002546 [Arthrobotrys conoides]|uniref:Uncharacterized protein n=1 Tax=Arthrobotrys conoides TaxID=74498 RepID=A0AAN8ND73_9PEZI
MRVHPSAVFLLLSLGYAIPGILMASINNHGPVSLENSAIHPPGDLPTDRPEVSLNSPANSHAPGHITASQATDATPSALSQGNIASRKPPVQDTSAIERERAVSSEMFFRFSVICPHPLRMISEEKPMSNYPIIGGYHKYSLRDARDNNARRTRARTAYRMCTSCKCNSNGKMIPDPRPRPTTPGAGMVYCGTSQAVAKCQLWYGCSCEAIMRHPQPDPEITVDEYQDALNNIPALVKIAHADYTWKFSEERSMTWLQPSDAFQDTRGSTEEYLVPGTKEPYSLEGPDQGVPWSGIPNPLLDLGSKLQESSASGLGLARRSSDKGTTHPSTSPHNTNENMPHIKKEVTEEKEPVADGIIDE